MTAPAPPDDATVAYFDHNSTDYARHRFDWYETIRREAGPVFWSPHHGGYWVIIGWQELRDAARDWQTFSSKSCEHNIDGLQYNGLFIPPRPGNGRLLQEDPPEWREARVALAPLFTVSEVAVWRDRVQRLVDACVDRRIETGSIDLASDIANVVPAVFSLEFVGVSSEHYELVARNHHLSSHLAADDPRWDGLREDLQTERRLIREAIARQKEEPGGGVIRALLDSAATGTAFSDDEIATLVLLTIGGGIDTTAALLASSLMLIADNPALRQALLDDPSKVPDAAEEFLRHAAPTQGLCRTVTRDVEIGGQRLRRGDRVMLCFAAACRDPEAFDRPDQIVLDRASNQHLAFGWGIHRCIGAQFAKLEFDVTLTTFLRRLPDYQMVWDQVVPFENVGVVAGWTQALATFTPGAKVGADPQILGWKP